MNNSVFIYSSLIDLPICEPCGYAVACETIPRHIKRCHPLKTCLQTEILDRLRSEQKKQKETPQDENKAIMQKKYLDTCVTDYRSGPPLPPLPAIPVKKCYKCPDCGYVAPKKDTVRRNCQASELCSGDGSSSLQEVRGQSIFAGKNCKYFQVTDYMASMDKPCPLAASMRTLVGSNPRHSRSSEPDVSEMNALLSTFRFDTHLLQHKLSLEQASELCHFADSETLKFAKDLISAYHERAFRITLERVSIKTHKLFDAPLSLTLNAKTVNLYNGRIYAILAFVYNIVQSESGGGECFPKDLGYNVKSLFRDRSVSAKALLPTLHAILYMLFFSSEQEISEQFMLFISCSSVHSSNGSFRYVQATELSPLLASLKFFARCAVVMHIYEYNRGDTSSAWQKILKDTVEHIDNGVRYPNYMLVVCPRLRDAEGTNIRFVICPKHSRCAIIDGVELSLQELGRKMRGVQRHCWSIMNEHLLRGLKISSDFWRAAEDLRDNLTDLTPAHWFGLHQANEHLLFQWSKNLLMHQNKHLQRTDNTLRPKRAKEFLRYCEELQEKLYVLLQTCSGAPARATEIGILRVCNTTMGSRNIFFHGGHLFTVVSYHKSRNLKQGMPRPIARFPDRETAGILLVYLFVIRPNSLSSSNWKAKILQTGTRPRLRSTGTSFSSVEVNP